MNGTQMNGAMRIILLDEHPFIRQGIKHYLTEQRGMAVVAETGDVAHALEAIDKLDPHLVILELRLMSGDTLEFIKSVKARFPLVRILVLSQFDEKFYAERVLRAGAHGFIMKQESSEEVFEAIQKVLKGELYLSKGMASALLSRLLQTPVVHAGHQDIECLSDREFQVFHMIGAGLSNREIALRLSLSIKTIETYRENIKHKFGLRSSAELMRHATHWLQAKGVEGLSLGEELVDAVCLPPASPKQFTVAKLGKGA